MIPSNFTMNTDYLTIAQISSKEFITNVGGGTLTGGAYTEQNFNFTMPAQNGAIDQIMISKDGYSFRIGSYMRLEISTSSPYKRLIGFVNISRTSPTNLQLKFMLENASPNSASFPSMSFKIKVSSFKPPNVF